MAARIITALVGAPALLAALWFGNPWLAGLAALAAIVGVWEFYRLYRSDDATLPVWLGSLWGLALVAAGLAADSVSQFLIAAGGISAAGGFACLLWLLGGYRGRKQLLTGAFLLAGPVYVSLALAHGVALREAGPGDLGRNWLLLAVLVTFATDTGAFFVGRSLGRHAMAPIVSPNKTWEGSVGGLLSAVAATAALGAVLDLGIGIWQQLLVGGAVGLVAQAGDLLESKLKRISQVKDTGSIMPGHGGLLDRLDSLALAVPTVYYVVSVIFRP